MFRFAPANSLVDRDVEAYVTRRLSNALDPVAEAVVDVPRKRGSQWSQLITSEKPTHR
jgi:hypothetical protein